MLLAPTLGLLMGCTHGPALLDGGQQAPAPATGPVVRFLALGDAGEGNAPQERVGQAMIAWCAAHTDERGPGCDFVAYLGDNFYPKGVSGPDDPQWRTKWAAPFAGLDLPFYAVLGNHDYGDPPVDRRRARAQLQGPADLPGWVMPGPWYAFDGGPARFVALDTQAVMMGWSHDEQGAFARQQLDAAGERWRVVLAHHPFKSNGQHGNAGDYEGQTWLPFASGKRIQRLYEDDLCGRSDLVLTGHEHNRQWLEPVCGMQIVIAGAGSKVTPRVDRGDPSEFEDDGRRGFLWVELTPEHLRAAFVDEHGETQFERELDRPSHALK